MKKGTKNIPSISYIIITPLPTPADPSPVRVDLGSNSFEGGDCYSNNPMNCVFDEGEIASIKCDGFMTKVPASSLNKKLACRYKCLPKSFGNKDECMKGCPSGLSCKVISGK